MKKENLMGIAIIMLLLLLTVMIYIFKPVAEKHNKDTIYINKVDTVFIYKDTIKIHYYKF